MCLMLAEALKHLKLLFCENLPAVLAILVILFDVIPVDVGHEVKCIYELTQKKHNRSKDKEKDQVEKDLTTLLPFLRL